MRLIDESWIWLSPHCLGSGPFGDHFLRLSWTSCTLSSSSSPPVWQSDAFPYITASVSKCVIRPGFSCSPRGLLNVIIAKACHMPVMYCRLALLAARWFSGGDDGLVPAGSGWAGLSWSRLGWALSHKHCVLLAHCSIEGNISYLCHTHTHPNEYGHFSAFMALPGTLSDSSCPPFAFHADTVHSSAA